LEPKDTLLSKLASPHAVILCYLALKAYQLVMTFNIDEESQIIIIGRVVGFLVPVLLAILTYKKIKVALWLMAFTLLVGGISGFLVGVIHVPMSQYYFKPIAIILGLYFTYGGIMLIKDKQVLLSQQPIEII